MAIHIRRREFIFTLGGAAAAWPLAAHAQQPGKVHRVGILWASTPSANAPRMEAFRQGLRELGYVEGRNVVIARWLKAPVQRSRARLRSSSKAMLKHSS